MSNVRNAPGAGRGGVRVIRRKINSAVNINELTQHKIQKHCVQLLRHRDAVVQTGRGRTGGAGLVRLRTAPSPVVSVPAGRGYDGEQDVVDRPAARSADDVQRAAFKISGSVSRNPGEK